jgi:hypothetical protein
LAVWGKSHEPNVVVHSMMMTRPGSQGEVDIVEGVNDQGPNVLSFKLHTGPGMWLIVTVIAQFDRTEFAFRSRSDSETG